MMNEPFDTISRPNKLYLYIPPEFDITDEETDKQPTLKLVLCLGNSLVNFVSGRCSVRWFSRRNTRNVHC